MFKRLSLVLVLCIAMGFPQVASGHEFDREEWTDAFEVLDYVVSPVSFAVEHLVLRPLHALLSIGPLEKVFGHEESEEAKCCEMEGCPGPDQASPCPHSSHMPGEESSSEAGVQ